MKKIFTVLTFIFCLSSLGFAQSLQGLNALVQEISKTVKGENNVKNTLHEFDITFTKSYLTEQYIPYENEMDEDYGQKIPTPEAKETAGYKETRIFIPAGYKIMYDQMFIDGDGKISFPTCKSIFMNINGKEVRFKFDYNILHKDAEPQQIINSDGDDSDGEKFTNILQPITIGIKYSPKYFTFNKYENAYSGEQTKEINYKGKKIVLKAVTDFLIKILDNDGKATYYVLEPNLQDIYNDFKFVRGASK